MFYGCDLDYEDNIFLEHLTKDVNDFVHSCKDSTCSKVLLLPPLNSRLRFLTHQLIYEYPELKSFSLGQKDARRTAITFSSNSNKLPTTTKMKKAKEPKNKKPDRLLYVPISQRQQNIVCQENSCKLTTPEFCNKISNKHRQPKNNNNSSGEEPQPRTLQKTDRKFSSKPKQSDINKSHSCELINGGGDNEEDNSEIKFVDNSSLKFSNEIGLTLPVDDTYGRGIDINCDDNLNQQSKRRHKKTVLTSGKHLNNDCNKIANIQHYNSDSHLNNTTTTTTSRQQLQQQHEQPNFIVLNDSSIVSCSIIKNNLSRYSDNDLSIHDPAILYNSGCKNNTPSSPDSGGVAVNFLPVTNSIFSGKTHPSLYHINSINTECSSVSNVVAINNGMDGNNFSNHSSLYCHHNSSKDIDDVSRLQIEDSAVVEFKSGSQQQQQQQPHQQYSYNNNSYTIDNADDNNSMYNTSFSDGNTNINTSNNAADYDDSYNSSISNSISSGKYYNSTDAKLGAGNDDDGKGGGDDEDGDSWFSKFDDTGDALDPSLLEELFSKVGPVKVEKSTINYLELVPPDINLPFQKYGHLLEIYNFSREITTADLMMAFNKFHSQGFDIKWVDDTHAIAIFNSSTTATTALTSFNHPIIKLRCIDQATRQTKVKISKCSDFLLPYKERPVTVTHVVRNLVAGALGIRTNVSKEKREEEKKKIQEAREKRKADLKSRKDAWEGNL